MAATAFASSPAMLALALAAIGLFAAIYHPIGTAMLVDAAGDKPGRAIGVNGVFGNIGRGAGPGGDGLPGAIRSAGAPPSCCRARPASCSGLLWLWVKPARGGGAPRPLAPFPEIPRHLVRRAVVVLLLIADRVRAGVQRLHAAAAEADAGAAGRRARACCRWSGVGGVPGDAVRRADAVHRRTHDRPHDAEARVPAGERAAGAGAGGVCPMRRAGWCCRPRQVPSPPRSSAR